MNIEKIVDTAAGEVKTQSRDWMSFLTHSDMNFEGRKEDEKIFVFTRRHWIVLVSPFFGGIVASILPLALVILGARMLVQYNLSGVFTLFWVLYIMVIWLYIFYKMTMHTLDTWIVTNERIIDMQQIALFSRKVSELHLESIQDVSVNIHGFLESNLDYGDVEIQTGATAQRFLFAQVPHPIDVKDKVMALSSEFEHDEKKID